jgi:hypothetical protein
LGRLDFRQGLLELLALLETLAPVEQMVEALLKATQPGLNHLAATKEVSAFH